MKKDNKFKIDFFELSFLVEACIPPRPIARAVFWHDVIDKHYYNMSKDERDMLFDWIQKNGNFNIKNEDCLLFYDRFNPDNQYNITTDINNKIEHHKTFKHGDIYYIKRNTSINEDYITNIEKDE